MYRRRIIKSRVMTKQDFIYQAARFFLHDEYLDIPTQLEILINSNQPYGVDRIEYADVYRDIHKSDLLTEIGHLAGLLETACTEGQKSKKYDRERISRCINYEADQD